MKDSKLISRRDLVATSGAVLLPLAVARAQAPAQAPQAPAQAPAAAQPPKPPMGPRRLQGEPYNPTDLNKPIGVAKGIYPGRVVWVHNPEVAKWDGKTGEFWDDQNTDQKVVDAMVSTALHNVTGKKDDKKAWDALFKHYNKTRNFGNAGYKKGEKLTIKVNMNMDRSTTAPWPSGFGLPSPQIIYSMLAQLVKKGGVPPEDIILYDVANNRYIGPPIVDKVNADPALKGIQFMCSVNRITPGRIPPVVDQEHPIRWANTVIERVKVPKQVVDAKYRINLATIRAHEIAGVTLCAKNNYGSLYWTSQDYWGPRPLHPYFPKTNKQGTYAPKADIMAHSQLGQKNILYMMEGLYVAEQSETKVIKFESFGDNWCSSLWMSQDPVAIDSVGLDFLRSEPRVIQVRGNPCNYLHEAALIENPPSGTKYAPDGERVSSLGVHEHWNNAKEKKYSRNLGTGKGIELLAVSAKV